MACHSDSLPFSFNQQRITSLRTSGIFSSPSSDPALAYLDLDALRVWRNNTIRPLNWQYGGGPVASLRQKQQRLLQPKNRFEDPYIAAVLIALAQGQRRAQQASQPEEVTTAGSSHLDTMPACPTQSPPLSVSEVTKISNEIMTYFQVCCEILFSCDPLTDINRFIF